MAIIKLDDSTIEKIAAGEVIESPMSIVKELVENSIDSGADNITVEIKNGGKTYIRVTDNGSGINKGELELAFSKHATSKITQFDDLYDMYSLGFRGEALASIVTVGKVTAITKTEEESIGSKIVMDNNNTNVSSIATNKGTSVVVENIFRDIPVRRKFLKSDIVEANRISKLMYAFAVGYNDISFKYIKNDNIEFQTTIHEDFKTKVSNLFDSTLGENLIKIKGSNDSYNIEGYISNTNYYRGNRSLQYIYINNRLIDSGLIRDRVEYTYRGNIPNLRYPAFFLYINTDSKNLDVNIHPNKRHIKFSYEEKLTELLDKLIENSLSDNFNPNEIKSRKEKEEVLMDFTDYSSILNKYNKVENQSMVRENNENSVYESDKNSKIEDEETNNFFDIDKNLFNESDKDKKSHEFTDISKDKNLKEKSNSSYSGKDISFISDFDHIRYKTSVFSRYSIFEKNKELFILDHRRASEKINLDKFIKQYKKKTIDKQLLLEAKILNLGRREIEKFKSKEEFINRLGFDVELMGEDSIIIRAVPIIFEMPENYNFFYDLLDLDYERDIDYLYNKLRKLNLSLAFRKGDGIGEKEATSYIKELFTMDNPYKTLDGKPTIIKFSEKDLENYFER